MTRLKMYMQSEKSEIDQFSPTTIARCVCVCVSNKRQSNPPKSWLHGVGAWFCGTGGEKMLCRQVDIMIWKCGKSVKLKTQLGPYLLMLSFMQFISAFSFANPPPRAPRRSVCSAPRHVHISEYYCTENQKVKGSTEKFWIYVGRYASWVKSAAPHLHRYREHFANLCLQ